MPKYQATYRDPVDNSITHYWQFEATNIMHAHAQAKDSILQRKDGRVDVLDKVEEIA
jgi:hypothetical protein